MRFLALALVALVTFVATPVYAENYLVLLAKGAGTPDEGEIIHDASNLTLQDGAEMLLLDHDGRIYRLTGPCACSLAFDRRAHHRADGLGQVSRFVVRAPAESRGGTRGSDIDIAGSATRPDIWDVVTDSSGDRCVRHGQIIFWRTHIAETLQVSLRSKTARKSGIVWEQGQHTLAIEDSARIGDGPLMTKIGTQTRRLQIHVIPSDVDPDQWGQVLIWMASMNCRRQAEMLIDAMKAGELFPEGSKTPGISEL